MTTPGMLRWGVLGAAGIAVRHVIPAMQQGRRTRVVAIASRDPARAEKARAALGLPRAHGSYEALLRDPDVDAVYVPLPNDLHVAWSIRALEAGKHVLCEKPIGLNAGEALQLAAAAESHPHLRVMEAFMYRFHPQWRRVRSLTQEGALGEVRAVQTWFSYYNVDPGNIRNRRASGGGALMDIGCYGISVPRFVFGCEPARVAAISRIDSRFGTDRLTSAALEFENGGSASFTCATQLARHQRVEIVGTDGRLTMDVPFNPTPDGPARIELQRGGSSETIVFDPSNQFTEQGDAFADAALTGGAVPTPLADAIANMRAIDAVRESAASGRPVDVRC